MKESEWSGGLRKLAGIGRHMHAFAPAAILHAFVFKLAGIGRRMHAFAPDTIFQVFVCVTQVSACVQSEHVGIGNAWFLSGHCAYPQFGVRLLCRKGQVCVTACACACEQLPA